MWYLPHHAVWHPRKSEELVEFFFYCASKSGGTSLNEQLLRGPESKTPKTHQMLVHIFGAKSSPSVAGYALRRSAQDNKQDVIDAVFRDFSVDDLLKSFPDSEQAIVVGKQLQELLARRGFELTKWISTSQSVLSAFPVEEREHPTLRI